MSLEDKAQDHEAQEWAIRNRPREVITHQPGAPGYGPAECNECTADMPAVRRSYGFKVCTACQQKFETEQSGRRRR